MFRTKNNETVFRVYCFFLEVTNLILKSKKDKMNSVTKVFYTIMNIKMYLDVILNINMEMNL